MLRSFIAGVSVLLSLVTLTLMGVDISRYMMQHAPETAFPMSLAIPLFAFPLYIAAIAGAWWGARAWGRWRFVALGLSVLPFVVAGVFVLF